MKMTRVYVYFNGAVNEYQFPVELETFMQAWRNQVPNGFYSGYDKDGQYVVINPYQCGAVEITEFKVK